MGLRTAEAVLLVDLYSLPHSRWHPQFDEVSLPKRLNGQG